jgi:hypothetical protein
MDGMGAMTLLDTVPCDGCSDETPDPVACEHRDLCPDCAADYGCSQCRRIHSDESWHE